MCHKTSVVDKYCYMSVQSHRMLNTKSESSRTSSIIICQCRSISCKKCTTLVSEVDHEGSMNVGADILRNLVPATQFCCESVTALVDYFFSNVREALHQLSAASPSKLISPFAQKRSAVGKMSMAQEAKGRTFSSSPLKAYIAPSASF